MKLRYSTFHNSNDILETEIPEGPEFIPFLSAVINYEILRSIDGRLTNFAYADESHIRRTVSGLISGGYIKNTVKVFAAIGTLTLDTKGRVIAIKENWKEDDLSF